MEVHERALTEALHRVDAEPGTGDASWFAARQPGVIKFLEGRLGRDDTMGVALMAAYAIHSAFERALGAAPARLPPSSLEQAEGEVLAETRAGEPSFVVRQQALAGFVAQVVAAPPVPLGEAEAGRLGLALASLVHALDRRAS